MKVPEDTQEFAMNASNEHFWEWPIKRYVGERNERYHREPAS